MPFRWTFSQTEELVHVVGNGSFDVSGAVEVLYAVTGSREFATGGFSLTSARWCMNPIQRMQSRSHELWALPVLC